MANYFQKRPKPYYAWVTWLAKLMAGEKLCKHAVWLLTQYQFDKLPCSFDACEHDEMVRERAIATPSIDLRREPP